MFRHFPPLALAAALVLSSIGLAAAAPASVPGRVPDQYIVVLNDSVGDPEGVAQAMAHAHGLGLLHTYSFALKGYAAVIPPSRLAAVQADPRVRLVSPDQEIELAGKPTPTGVDWAGQTTPTGVDRIDAELTATHTNTGLGAHVAVVDTGIDLRHSDLKANIAGGKNCSNGRSYNDGHGHGTHVAGTIAALNNSTGVVGVAPEAKLWAVRVLNNAGSGTLSSLICGIDFVTAKAPANGGPITVANLSLGASGSDDGNCGQTNGDPLHLAICRSVAAGVTYVVAAGNSAADAASQIPAAYDEVITVSALADFNGQPGGGAAATCRADVDDTFADFSNFGADVDIAAPGVCILSTWKGGGYATISGTSMASPHVAGAAALYIATHPGVTPAQVREALLLAQEPGPIPGDPDAFPEGIVRAASL